MSIFDKIMSGLFSQHKAGCFQKFSGCILAFRSLGPPLQCLWGFKWQMVSTMKQAKRGFYGHLTYSSFWFNPHLITQTM